MHPLRGTMWGPRPLPELLTGQLSGQGFQPADAAVCAQRINESPHANVAASLFVSLGSCKFLDGDIDGAVAAWRHALSGGDDDAASIALLNLGLLYEHLHLHERALAVLESTADRGVAATTADAVMASARVRRELGDSDGAMEALARLTQSMMADSADHDRLAETLLGFGELALDAGRADRAERAWRAAAASADSAAQRKARAQLMALLTEAGRDEELADLFAVTDDGAAPSTTETDMGLLLDRADALVRSGDDDGARELARITTTSSARIADRFRLAQLRCGLGLVNEAIDELEPLLTHDDIDVRQRAAVVLGEIYLDHEMDSAALSMFERAAEQPDDFWSRKAAISLGDILFAQREREQALEYWTFASASPVGPLRSLGLARLENAYAHPAEPEIGMLSEFDDDDAIEAAAIGELEPAIVLLDDARPQPDDEIVLGDPGIDADVDAGEEIVLGDAAADAAIDAGEEIVLGDADNSQSHVAPHVLVLDDVAALDDSPRPDHIDDWSVTEANGNHAGVSNDPVLLDDIPAAATSHVIVLDELESTSDNAGATAVEQVVVEPAMSAALDSAPVPVPTAAPAPTSAPVPQASAFRELSDVNPYAALAPEANDDDPVPSPHNPYAELAPNYDTTEMPQDVEPGDWESLLEGWPGMDDDGPSTKPDDGTNNRSSAFSRYT